MTEEQIEQKFRELFPEYTVKNSEVCLSPYIDIFEVGTEIATKELQEENRQLKNIKDVADLLRLNNDTVITMCQLNNELVSANQRIADLEKQIEKMKRCEMCKNHNWQGCVFSSEKRLDCINNKRNLFELKE